MSVTNCLTTHKLKSEDRDLFDANFKEQKDEGLKPSEAGRIAAYKLEQIIYDEYLQLAEDVKAKGGELPIISKPKENGNLNILNEAQEDGQTEQAVDREEVSGNEGDTGTERDSGNQVNNQNDDPGLEEQPTRDVQTPAGTGNDTQTGVRTPGDDVAGSVQTGEVGVESSGREDGSVYEPSNAGVRGGRTGQLPDDLENFHIDDPKVISGGTQVERFNKNKDAIETYQELSDENKSPTPEQQAIIAGYTGWGSYGQELFQGTWENPKYIKGQAWIDRNNWLREHLGKEDWESAQRSIINAHYTDANVITAMWNIAEKMGFNGGRVLEPAMGIGNFFGLMPKGMKDNSQLTGIELDSLTGGMAKMLYPQSNISVKGYQESKTPDDFYDLAISNVPFEDTHIADRKYLKLNPYLHDYFFLKMLDQVRPGGLVMAVTSKGTMDKVDPSIRRALAKKAKFVGAIRLPSGAFQKNAGTKVVTDIIILQKRDEPLGVVDDAWIQSPKYAELDNKINVNQYFQDNLNNILGELTLGRGLRSDNEMIVTMPPSLQGRLNGAVKRQPDNIYTPLVTTKEVTYITNHTDDRQGALVKKDDGFYIVQGEHLALADTVRKWKIKSQKSNDIRQDQFEQLIDIRSNYAALIEKERSADNENLETLRKTLNDSYKKFVKAHGLLNDSYGLKYLRFINDPFNISIAALEVNGKPAKILTQSTIRPPGKIKNPTINDSYVLARNKFVSPRLEDIAEIANKTVDEVRTELVNEDLVYVDEGGSVIPADVYLSGNVKIKLRSAQASIKEGHTEMQRNVDALLAVVPKDIPYHEIEAKMGASWINPEYYNDYVKFMLNTNHPSIETTYRFGKWKVDFNTDLNHTPEASTGFGTPVASFKRLINHAISNQLIKIMSEDADGTKYVNTAATEEANQKIANMRDEFSEWIWSDVGRRIALENEYNEVRNAYAEPNFDGSFLTFEGMALQLGENSFNLRKHQSDAIWRAIVKRKSLNAHEVGTGKTFTLGGIAIESRRYGIAKKPLILAHNANSAAVYSEVQEMYPGAKLLYIDNLDKKTIKMKMQQIANDDWDAIVMPHSQVNNLALTEDTLMGMAAEEIEALETEAREAASDDDVTITEEMWTDPEELKKLQSATAKELVKERNKIIETIRKQGLRATREGAVAFEDLGIDMLLVDEAHEFKKPPIVTKMKMKGFNAASSNRSISLRFLTKYVRSMNNGGNIHLFTGTPITNTLTEIYHQQRYLMEEEMSATGVDFWDGWFGSFASEVQDIEQASSGEFEDVTRLAAFINIPELRKMIGQYMDVVFSNDMPEMQPRKTQSGKILSDKTLTDAERNELENGRTEDAHDRPYKKIIALSEDMSDGQLAAFEQVKQWAREFKAMTGKDKRTAMLSGDENTPLMYEQYAEKASFDIRLLNARALAGQEGSVPDTPNSKASRAVDNVSEIYKSDDQASQVIFMDKYISQRGSRSVGEIGNKSKETFPVFSVARDIVERLVNGGIPRNEIAIVDLNVKGVKRKEIADKMNTGEIRVVIGSTQSLGVGVNMQKNLRAIHHLDAPWMPGELEQRNGRGHRQGNQNNTVLEYRYLTDRIDGRRWQVLAKKAKFINQFMRSKGEIRNLEGDAVTDGKDDILDTFAEAAGDPRILLKEQYKKKIKNFERKERLYSQSINDAKMNIKALERRIEKDTKEVNDLKAEQSIADKILKDKTDATTVEGIDYETKAKADARLKVLGNKVIGVKDTRDIGILYGQPAQLYRNANNEVQIILTVDGMKFASLAPNLTSLETALRGTRRNKDIERNQKEIELDKNSLERMKEVAKEPFKSESLLKQSRQDLRDIEQDMRDNPNPPPVWLRNGAPAGTDVYVNGQAFEVLGHSYTNDGWFIKTVDGKTIPYTNVTDEQGMALYEERQFIRPDGEAVTIDNTISEADKALVPDEVIEDGQMWAVLKRNGKYKKSGNSVTDIKHKIARRVRKLNRIFHPKVVQSVADLPANDFNIPIGTKGVFLNGSIYIIADNNTIEEVSTTLAHEVYGHAAVEFYTGKQFDKAIKLVQHMKASKNPKVMAALKIIKKEYVDDNGVYELDAMQEAREIIAHIAETDTKHPLIKKIIAMIKAFIAKRGWGMYSVEDAAIARLLAESAQFAENKNTNFVIGSNGRPAALKRGGNEQQGKTGVMSKIGEDRPDIVTRAKDWLNDTMTEIRQGMFDRYDVLLRNDKAAYGDDVLRKSTSSSAWVLAKFANASEGAIHAMLDYGRVKMDDEGMMDAVDDKSVGLIEILKPLKSKDGVNKFFAWIATSRSKQITAKSNNAAAKIKNLEAQLMGINEELDTDGLLAVDYKALNAEKAGVKSEIKKQKDLANVKERLFTPEDIAEGDKFYQDNKKVYDSIYKQFNQMQQDVLDTSVKGGILSETMAEQYKAEFYIPFYRMLKDEDAQVNPYGGVSGLSRQKFSERLKGGEENLGDLLENTITNWNNLIAASLKNKAATAAIDTASSDTLQLAKEVNENVRDKKASTYILKNGKKVWYDIDDKLTFRALTSLQQTGMNNNMMKIMRAFKRTFTSFTTASPQFIAANLMRDSIQAAALADMNYNPVANAITGINKFSDKNRNKHRMIASGGAFSFGHIYGDDPDAIKQSVEREMNKSFLVENPKDAGRLIKTAWDKYQSISNRAENANRITIYEKAIADGKTHQQASLESRDLMDFSARGDWVAVRILTDIVPFLNARLQGLDKLYRSGGKPIYRILTGKASQSDEIAAARFAIIQGAVGLAAMSLYMSNKDDEEYQELEDWERDTYFHIKVGDAYWRMPRPFEIGALATLAERMLEQVVDDKATGKLFRERFGHMLLQTFAFNPAPQMVKPLIDMYANKDSFTGRAIESVGMQNLSPENRSRSYSSITAKLASKGLAGTFGSDSSLVLSPVKIDFLIQQYLGWVGASANGLVDSMANPDVKPAKNWYELNPMKRFYKELPSQYSKYTTQFYDNLVRARRVYNDIKYYREIGNDAAADELIDDNQELLRARKRMNKSQKLLSKINKRLKFIRRDNDMSPSAKREDIRLLMDRKRAIARRYKDIKG